MKRKEIEFNPENLIASVEALARHASGKKNLRLKTKSLKAPSHKKCKAAAAGRDY